MATKWHLDNVISVLTSLSETPSDIEVLVKDTKTGKLKPFDVTLSLGKPVKIVILPYEDPEM